MRIDSLAQKLARVSFHHDSQCRQPEATAPRGLYALRYFSDAPKPAARIRYRLRMEYHTQSFMHIRIPMRDCVQR